MFRDCEGGGALYIYIFLGAEYGIWRYELAGDLAKTLSVCQVLKGSPIIQVENVSARSGLDQCHWLNGAAIQYYVCICATEIYATR